MCRAQEQDLISAEVDCRSLFTRIQSHRLSPHNSVQKPRSETLSPRFSVSLACACDELFARMIVVSRVDLEHLFPRRLASSSITPAKTL